MIFIKDPNKIYAKVWRVDKKENYTAVSISTSDKQQDGSYKNSSWSCRLVGKAKDVIVEEGDLLTINSAKIENIYDKEAKKCWLNIIVFDAYVKQGWNDENGFKPENAGDWQTMEEDEILPF